MRRKGLRFPNGIPRAAMSDNPPQADINAVTVADNEGEPTDSEDAI